MMEQIVQQVINTEFNIINASDWIQDEPEELDQVLEGIIDIKDKLAVIGSSKLRKSFLLLQLLLCIATGRRFLNWDIPKPRRIFHIQFEIQSGHFHRRLRRMCKALGITTKELGDRFRILNARGLKLTGKEGLEKISSIIEFYHPEVISIDPFYKLSDGGENAIEEVKQILNMLDSLIEENEAALIYVHHDSKGNSGDRDIRDRGAGSNVIGRDYDACITLTPHSSEPDAAVIETINRNYPPQEPFTVLWEEEINTAGYFFNLRDDILPTKKTSANSKAAKQLPLSSYLPVAQEILRSGPMNISVFKDTLRGKTDLTFKRSDDFKKWATAGTKPPLDTYSKRARGVNETLIGFPADIARMRGLE
jgi:RecA-family ATPase